MPWSVWLGDASIGNVTGLHAVVALDDGACEEGVPLS